MSSIALRYFENKDEAVHKMNSGFLKVLQNLKQFNSQFSIATFIRNVLIHHIIDELRKEKKYSNHIPYEEHHENQAGVSNNLGEIKIETVELLNLLNRLPEMTKRVFNLYAIDGYKHSEIAEILGISEGTSKWHVSDARKKLKELLQLSEIPRVSQI